MESTSTVRSRHVTRQGRKWMVRGIGSKNIWLVLIWEFIISCSMVIVIQFSLYIYDIGDTLGTVILSVSFPVASLLAEVVTSRYKLTKYCLRATWLLTIFLCILTLTSADYLPEIVTTIVSILTSVMQGYLLRAYFSCAVPLGIDQIVTGTSANISAFIQWIWWAYYTGIALPSFAQKIIISCTEGIPSRVTAVISLLPVILLSVGLILDIFFSHKLVQEPVTVNPVTLIFKVLKYAAKHRHPVQRSAFTYCDDRKPSRLDYGKSKYGGPFTTEQVEDVKTFWRLLLVILTTSTIYFPTIVIQVSATSNLIPQSGCRLGIIQAITDPFCILMFGIPLYELLVYPCLRHRGPSIRLSIGIGALALVISSLYGLGLETMQKFALDGNIQCRFSPSVTCILAYIPLKLMIGFTIGVLGKSVIEFICAQAPYNMKGLLIGFYFTGYLFSLIAAAILLLLLINGIWLYLTTLGVTLASCVLLVCVIRRYQGRERDEMANSQTMVEEIYYKYHEQEQAETQEKDDT